MCLEEETEAQPTPLSFASHSAYDKQDVLCHRLKVTGLLVALGWGLSESQAKSFLSVQDKEALEEESILQQTQTHLNCGMPSQ